ncbi:MAG TPA: CoA-binding protein [Chitinispirillaceae bacterium]|nr:CoA-binding protein [Chitinispirillaceae bacterium]
MKKKKTAVILGASKNPARYSFQALLLLKNKGHRIIPVNPILDIIENIPVVHSLSEIKEKIDTLTLYVNPERSESLSDEIFELKPDRVIFNPGTESEKLKNELEKRNIACIEACTLVLLKTGMF